jgi:hypothetical protein
LETPTVKKYVALLFLFCNFCVHAILKGSREAIASFHVCLYVLILSLLFINNALIYSPLNSKAIPMDDTSFVFFSSDSFFNDVFIFLLVLQNLLKIKEQDFKMMITKIWTPTTPKSWYLF